MCREGGRGKEMGGGAREDGGTEVILEVKVRTFSLLVYFILEETIISNLNVVKFLD